jgi:hypothetical protein
MDSGGVAEALLREKLLVRQGPWDDRPDYQLPPGIDRQAGKNGLGIEAQREIIARFGTAEGSEVVAEFVEVETGKGSVSLGLRGPRLGRWWHQKTPAVCISRTDKTIPQPLSWMSRICRGLAPWKPARFSVCGGP